MTASKEPRPVARPPPEADGAAVAAGRGFTLVRNAPLRHRNTMRVDAHATWLAEVHDTAGLPELLAHPALRDQAILVLGEGSNVLFVGDFEGAVVTVKTRGVEVLAEGDEDVRIRVAAGETWDDFVRWTLAQGHPGLENLVLIPGSVGAAPMQNIGAYGVEAGEFIESVEGFDLEDRQPVLFDQQQCEFGYRDSVFKRHPDRWLITAVTLRLPRKAVPRTDYAGLAEELARRGVRKPAPGHVAEAVIALRTRKLPDPAVIGNAGSFFKNPLVAGERAAELRAEFPQLPAWPAAAGFTKLSAAWLIESCGFKGLRDGDAGISNRHALVLVNHGSATGVQLWSMAQRVRDGVHERFDVRLEPEPRIIGLS